MLRFRTLPSQPIPGSSADLLAVSQVIEDALQPGNFFVAADLPLNWLSARSETIPWEIFRGRLLEPAHTRETRIFLSWHVLDNANPVLSVRLDVHTRHLHVTRGILCHVWEGYDAGGGVIDSRETVRWSLELVGTISLNDLADLNEVHDELICLLWQAVVGTSRLPLTSLEAPLPAFVLGRFHFLYQPDAPDDPVRSWSAWVERAMHGECSWLETVKLVEFALRHLPTTDLPRLVPLLPPERETQGRLLRAMFNAVSLSPYTGFVDNAVALIEMLEAFDVVGSLIRQLCRHLTAYDLITFHHRGANYPDALLLDALLKAYLRHLETTPEAFTGADAPARLRRRAIRQGLLLRRGYEGHPVPDAPTSPGENARVMPASHPRVPEEQFLQTHRRRRQLFVGDPVAGLLTPAVKRILAESLHDLQLAEEQVELGRGVFIDRPLGYGKSVGEPDQTPLLAHEAYSPGVARRRLQELRRLCQEAQLECDEKLFEQPSAVVGFPGHDLADSPRPTAALADVRRVADDFVILRTLPVGLADCLANFDWRPLTAGHRLAFLDTGVVRLCVQALGPALILADTESRRRVELRVDTSQGYFTRAGVELPRAGLLVLAVWEDGCETVRRELPTPIRIRIV